MGDASRMHRNSRFCKHFAPLLTPYCEFKTGESWVVDHVGLSPIHDFGPVSMCVTFKKGDERVTLYVAEELFDPDISSDAAIIETIQNFDERITEEQIRAVLKLANLAD